MPERPSTVAPALRPARGRTVSNPWAPTGIEALAVAAVVVGLWPLFDAVAAFGDGRDARFAAASVAGAVPATAGVAAAAVGAAKDAATRALLGGAGLQWAGAVVLGYGLLLVSRARRIPPLGGAALALVAWAAAAWIADVGSPFAPRAAFEPARGAASAFAPFGGNGPAVPAPFVLATAALAVGAALLAARWSGTAGADAARPRQTMSTRIGYAGLALWTGLGALVLLDLSAHAHRGNRYLALYHQSHLWLGFAIFSTLACLREPLTRGLARTLALAGEAVAAAERRVGTVPVQAALFGLALAAVGAVAASFANLRQLTSELGRIWIAVGAAWFFYLRAAPLADRVARDGGGIASLARAALPLAFVVVVLLAAMLATRDLGPLLIAGYGAGAFVAAALASRAHRLGLAGGPASALGMAAFALWIAAVTAALFAFGRVDPTTAERLESLATPFTAANDQQALVAWFRAATPEGGFGIGRVPWCGWSASGGCGGVPAQVHSDYTFTAFVGAFGWSAAWAIVLGTAFWLHRLVRHHGRVTTGVPRLAARPGGGVGSNAFALDGQALASWIALAWVVLALCQLAVTVAGNLGVLPLTGVTFPFASFGLTSNAVGLAFLALAIQVTVPPEADHG